MSEGPLEVTFDQPNGSLVFKCKNWEFGTDKLKKDDDYFVELMLYYKDAVIECKFLDWWCENLKKLILKVLFFKRNSLLGLGLI